jgi:hypothetical protein
MSWYYGYFFGWFLCILGYETGFLKTLRQYFREDAEKHKREREERSTQ